MPDLRPSEQPSTSKSHKEATRADIPLQAESDVQPRQATQYGHSLPPLASLASLSSSGGAHHSPGSHSPIIGRGFGMHDLLNPSNSATAVSSQEVRHSPHRSAGTNFAGQPPSISSPRGRKRVEPASPAPLLHATPDGRQPRRMLTPKSPALRALSTGARLSPSIGHASTYASTVSDGRVYMIEPGDHRGQIPNLPAMPTSVPNPASAVLSSRQGVATPRTSLDSSSASYSTGPQIGMDSPRGAGERLRLSPPVSALFESGPYSGPRGVAGTPDGMNRGPQRAVTTGLAAYQMQLNTEAGPITVDVDVDTQQASKLADEKRKRNAGASARFRQRRKEKEQAASQAIADLQRQMRELTEDRDFYMHERDFFRDIYLRTPGAQAQPRPASPRVRRMQGPGQPLIQDVSPQVDYGRRDVPEGMPPQRRRTGDYRPSFSSSSSAAASTSYPPYAPPAYALPPPPPSHAPPPPPGPATDPRASALPPSQGIRAQQYDPFRREQPRHG